MRLTIATLNPMPQLRMLCCGAADAASSPSGSESGPETNSLLVSNHMLGIFCIPPPAEDE